MQQRCKRYPSCAPGRRLQIVIVAGSCSKRSRLPYVSPFPGRTPVSVTFAFPCGWGRRLVTLTLESPWHRVLVEKHHCCHLVFHVSDICILQAAEEIARITLKRFVIFGTRVATRTSKFKTASGRKFFGGDESKPNRNNLVDMRVWTSGNWRQKANAPNSRRRIVWAGYKLSVGQWKSVSMLSETNWH